MNVQKTQFDDKHFKEREREIIKIGRGCEKREEKQERAKEGKEKKENKIGQIYLCSSFF